ncbi:MTH538 TIR-like domain (DUF1863) [Serratia proteamaculans]|jgi:hypothetical protein|uniref:TIR domain-containing protein n=1 Tax=Serratia proteamaculans TaxID=28151 RepID=A0ABS0TVR4_SERPR|nr:TIR domain-containing protein [Serratia proteamaculans]KAB1494766.1 TIR domain-containing protein [Serratia proteamaculans]MBI6182447.1 TIR domain-containing protein [Serratia proteamaculans]NWA74642.1 TIR domain-containing protein [Serratia proteamaculans]RYM49323.1 hypothetical protein BSQ97_20655 [Serratia proteamaculans]RYM49386.1 hypothetical protein BSQ96_19690 [Serratia proteamaculans]
MTRRCFYSFHYQPDNWRVSQVRSIGSLEGNPPARDNDWEEVTKGGDAAIADWIQTQLTNRSCIIVLAGEDTANRKWINHEICEAWKKGMGVLVVYIHNLKDSTGEQAAKGNNPLDYIKLGENKLSAIAKAYDPPYSTSTKVYEYIEENLADWVEEAIRIRNNY